MVNRPTAAWIALAVVLAASCARQEERPAGSSASSAGAATAAPATPAASATPEDIPPPAYESVLPEVLRAQVTQSITGDLDELVRRRVIRVGVTFSRTFYFVDKGTQRGIVYEYMLRCEETLNKRLNTGNLKVHVVMLPMPRDQLFPALRAGKIDMVVAQLTVTPERQKLVDFSAPTRTNVDEIVVTAPGAPALASADDLSGREVFVRKTSSYYEHLLALNDRLKAAGRPPVNIQLASESLEDDDLLEMVNAGLLPAIIVDNYLATFWKQVFTKLNVREDLALHKGGTLAVAIRQNSPKLKEALNSFIDKNGLDSTFGAILNKRYLQNTKFVRDATSEAERQKFLALVDLFRKYGDRYKFDYLLMAAQGYQESRLDQQAKSPVGAVGVMQLMPETGKEQKVGDISKVDPNVHAGVKYMRFIRNSFFEEQPMDDLNKGLFTFAAYNAGPGRVRQLQREAAQRGLDPNVWFGNVERIASERIGRETVTYVSNIYKYYVAYRLLQEEMRRKKAASAAGGGTVQ